MSALSSHPLFRVTPLAGVWIEILGHSGGQAYILVTPLAGVWIEIAINKCADYEDLGHSPRGSVD